MRKILFISSLLYSALSFGQQDFVLAGGDATGSNGSVSYSFGQVAYESITGSNGAITQGVQQPFEVYTLSLPDESLQIVASLYPNPAAQTVTLLLDSSILSQNFSFEMYDLNGRLIKNERIINSETPIDISSIASATYFVNVVSNNNIRKTFKLIKNN